MLLAALSVLAMASAPQVDAPQVDAPAQAPAGRSFEDLLIAVRGRCPPMEPKIRALGPAGLTDLEDGFGAQLSPANRSRLDQAVTRADARCADRTDGSCRADARLSALIDTDLIGAFADYACARESAETR